MDKDILQKAKELDNDIENIEKILRRYNKGYWIQVIYQGFNGSQSERFQDDLAEWLKLRKEMYEKELADL